MAEPTQKAVNEVRQLELDRVAKINQVSFSIIDKVRLYTNKRIKPIFDGKTPEAVKRQIEAYLIANYNHLFNDMKNQITENYNQSKLESRYLADVAKGSSLAFTPTKMLLELPSTEPFKITNKILSTKSILSRNKTLADRVTKIIDSSVKKGRSIERTTKLLDIEFGYRNARGVINDKMLKLIKSGRFTHTNGHFYQTYRIARTESLRMNAIANNELLTELQGKYSNTRLKMISAIDLRTREQSIQMNGDISTKKGRFFYPDGNYYRHGEAPAKYSVNDRESTYTIFLDEKNIKGLRYKAFDEYIADRKKDIID